MIQVTWYRNKEGLCTGFHLDGHAEYAEYGRDIVCAAVSVLAINTMNSIEAFTDDTFEGQIGEETGTVDFRFVSDPGEKSVLLMQSLFLGLQGIRKEYGEKFIRIEIKE